MKFVPMTSHTLPACARVFVSAFNGEPWKESWTEEIALERLGNYLACPTFFGLVLEEEGEVIAFLCGQHEPYYDAPRFYIQEFCCVRPGGGVGTRLLEEAEGQLRARGVRNFYLMTSRGERTEGYYSRRGYRTMEETVWMIKEG